MIQTFLECLFARLRDLIGFARIFKNSLHFLMDELLRRPQLRVGIHYKRMLRAPFAGQIRNILCYVRVLCPELLDHLRRKRLRQYSRIGVVLCDIFDLLESGARFRGLHMCIDKLVVEVGNC